MQVGASEKEGTFGFWISAVSPQFPPSVPTLTAFFCGTLAVGPKLLRSSEPPRSFEAFIKSSVFTLQRAPSLTLKHPSEQVSTDSNGLRSHFKRSEILVNFPVPKKFSCCLPAVLLLFFGVFVKSWHTSSFSGLVFIL